MSIIKVNLSYQQINKKKPKPKPKPKPNYYTLQHIRECIQCKIYEIQKVETLEIIPLPKGPWEMVGSEMFQLKGKMYILIVDNYSLYIEVSILDKGETSKTIIEKIKTIFSNMKYRIG